MIFLFFKKLYEKFSAFLLPTFFVLSLILSGTTYYYLTSYTELKASYDQEVAISKSHKEQSEKIDNACLEKDVFKKNNNSKLDQHIKVIEAASTKVSSAKQADPTNVLNMELPDEVLEVLDSGSTNSSD